MAKKILIAFDFNKNEIQNAVLQVLASAPSSPSNGQFYFDSVVKRPMFYDSVGAAFLDLTARANHSGTQLASTISNFAATVVLSRLDQMAAPTAAVAMNGQKLSGVLDPTSAQDAATKNYVDNAVNGTDWKASCRAATTANITLSAPQTIDGVSVIAGDRVLVKNQTTGSQNGIYVCGASGWTRSLDADGTGVTGEVSPQMTVMIEEGSTLASTQWRVTNTGVITVGTTAITFAQIGAGVSYTAGAGISLSGTVIAVDTTVVARKYATAVGDGSATSIVVTHSLGTVDIICQVRDATSGALVECDQAANSTTQVTLTFAVAPTASQYRCVVLA